MCSAKATLSKADILTLTAGLLCGLVTLSIRLSVCILLSMLQTELMAHFKGLTYCSHNTHGLSLTGKREEGERVADRQTDKDSGVWDKTSVFRAEVFNNEQSVWDFPPHQTPRRVISLKTCTLSVILGTQLNIPASETNNITLVEQFSLELTDNTRPLSQDRSNNCRDTHKK